MGLIPADLRSPLVIRRTGLNIPSSNLRAICAVNPALLTLGLAFSGTAPAVLEVGGVKAAAAAYGSAAVAVTRLKRVGGRIFGIPVAGVGPVAQGVTTGGVLSTFGWTFITTQSPWILNPQYIQNPYGFSATLEMRWTDIYGASGSMSMEFGPQVRRQLYGEVLGPYFGGVGDGSRAKHIASGVGTWSSPLVTSRTPSDWTTGVAALAWPSAGLPWWGVAESAARAGNWVRRAAWAPGRQIRFEEGAGTTRAVAVQITQGQANPFRVTTADFGVAEFLADDWIVVGDSEPARVDVTDFVFQGPSGATFFAVLGSQASDGAGDGSMGSTGTDGIGSIADAGFVWRRADGSEVLVPARTVKGEDWMP